MPKKKKGVDKEKKSKKKSGVNERETVFYEQQILDNNRQLARLRTRNQELETEIESMKQKLRQLEEDRSDVIAHLKRNLQQTTEEAQELSERLYALEELRKEEQVAYKRKEEMMQDEYRTMENNLSTEIKLAEGKLNALEEWRLARLDLMKKFEIQEEQMMEQEIRHKETLCEVEKELIISKAKMQKEMEERLNKLAQDFMDVTNIRIADTTHRAIRENIALNRELDVMFKVCREVDKKMEQYKKRGHKLKLQASLYQAEARNALKKVLKQNCLIKKLTEDHYDMVFSYGQIQTAENNARINGNLLQEYKSKCIEAQEKMQTLRKQIEETQRNKEQMIETIVSKSEDIKKLKDILHRAKQCIISALNLNANISDKSLSNQIADSEKFLQTLLDILKNDSCLKNTLKTDKIYHQAIENQYVHGNLGLVPCSHYIIFDKPESREDQEEIHTNEEEENEEKNEGTSFKLEKESLVGGQHTEISEYSQTDSDSSDVFSLIESLQELMFNTIKNDDDSDVLGTVKSEK